MERMDRIRNFCIIAHIDHGKSTLADRLLEKTGVFEKREMVEQVLDSMELERERGITIKSKAVHMQYKAQDGETYTLNLIDTPGHVDFTYEVSRALAACEGALMEVCQNKRGVFKDMVYEGQRVCLHYEMPLAEIIFDFFDQIKSRSRGYASYDYELCGYQQSDLVKLDILLNGDPCDALSMIVHRDRAYARGRSIAEKLKDVIPRQMFEIPIQAAIGGKVIARETVKAMRKDVLAKCYGGDISRKRKLLEKQKEGKKRMRQLGNVQVPSEAFMAVLKMDE